MTRPRIEPRSPGPLANTNTNSSTQLDDFVFHGVSMPNPVLLSKWFVGNIIFK